MIGQKGRVVGRGGEHRKGVDYGESGRVGGGVEIEGSNAFVCWQIRIRKLLIGSNGSCACFF